VEQPLKADPLSSLPLLAQVEVVVVLLMMVLEVLEAQALVVLVV
jgi:hypothetical protein